MHAMVMTGLTWQPQGAWQAAAMRLLVTLVQVLFLPMAVAGVWAVLAALWSDGAVDFLGVLVLLGCTAVVYGGDRLLDPSAQQRQLPGFFAAVSIAGVIVVTWVVVHSGFVLFERGWGAGVSVLGGLWPAVLCTAVLPWARRVLGGKELMVAACWASACIGAARPDVWPHDWVSLSPLWVVQFLLFYAGVLLCDFKDTDVDRENGRRTLASYGDGGVALRLALGCSLAVVVLTWEWRCYGIIASAVALMVLVHVPRVLKKPVAASLLVDGALCFPLIDVVMYGT